MFRRFLELEGLVLLWVQEHLRMGFLSSFFVFLTTTGNKGLIWVLFSLGMLPRKKTRLTGMMCLLALALSVVVNNIVLKNLIGRVRPYEIYSELVTLIPHPTDLSFPSGHTAASFACAGVICQRLPREYGVPAIVLAVLIGFSRIYIGVHYPSDVVAGAISGLLLSVLTVQLLKNVKMD